MPGWSALNNLHLSLERHLLDFVDTDKQLMQLYGREPNAPLPRRPGKFDCHLKPPGESDEEEWEVAFCHAISVKALFS